jgi:subtilisin-like proprotein convertase family protein
MKAALNFLIATLFCASVSAAEMSYTNSSSAAIPDANPTGIMSVIDVTDAPGWITEVELTLTISGGFNGDFYAYLTSDAGGFSVLLNRPGRTSSNPFGYEDPGMTLTLSDAAPLDIHLYGGSSGSPLTGTWQPDGRNVSPQFALDSDPRTAGLSVFNGNTANGRWTLFLSDMASGGGATLVNWSISLKTIPEPSPFAFVLTGLGLFASLKFRRGSNRN